MIPFRLERDGTITARFTSDEARVLRDLSEQLAIMLLDRSAQTVDAASAVLAQAGIGGGRSAPVDPALARLLPDAYADDADAASEHRHLTESSLIERKAGNARTVAAALQSDGGPVPVRLDPAAVQAWLRTLTDLRLTLAARLEIVQDGDEGRADDDRDLAMLDVYDWLGALQGTLIECLDA